MADDYEVPTNPDVLNQICGAFGVPAELLKPQTEKDAIHILNLLLIEIFRQYETPLTIENLIKALTWLEVELTALQSDDSERE